MDSTAVFNPVASSAIRLDFNDPAMPPGWTHRGNELPGTIWPECHFAKKKVVEKGPGDTGGGVGSTICSLAGAEWGTVTADGKYRWLFANGTLLLRALYADSAMRSRSWLIVLSALLWFSARHLSGRHALKSTHGVKWKWKDSSPDPATKPAPVAAPVAKEFRKSPAVAKTDLGAKLAPASASAALQPDSEAPTPSAEPMAADKPA